MVVEVVEDLDAGVVGELPVSEVALPHLVGQIGLEADERALGPLLRLWRDQPVALEDAPDGGDGWSVGACQRKVVVDGVWAGVVSCGVQLTAQGEDRFLELGSGGVRARLGTARLRFEGGLPAGAIAGHQLGDPGFGDTGGGCHISMGAAFAKDCLNDIALPAHGALHVNVVGTMS